MSYDIIFPVWFIFVFWLLISPTLWCVQHTICASFVKLHVCIGSCRLTLVAMVDHGPADWLVTPTCPPSLSNCDCVSPNSPTAVVSSSHVLAQGACVAGCRVTLVAFVRLFSALSDCWQPAVTISTLCLPPCPTPGVIVGTKASCKLDTAVGTSWCQLVPYSFLVVF